MKRHIYLVVPLLIALMGCERDPPVAAQAEAPSSNSKADEHKMAEGHKVAKAHKMAGHQEASAMLVEVTAEGTIFEPAVLVSEIPPGAYMCDMGEVHYARKMKSDKPCPVCGMALTQKPTGAAKTDVTDHKEGDGHSH